MRKTTKEVERICVIDVADYEATLRAMLVTTYHDWYKDAVELLLREGEVNGRSDC